tara:strand:- start:432 stop:686 length:255 start_codon:yes stop_codon:yes gene_type:complete
MLNTEQICKDAIEVVERYLASDLVAADMHDELREAQDAVDDAWDMSNSRKSHRICRAAWHACLAAKNDERSLAKVSVNEFWDRV